jgi:hypothetical protein
VVGPIGYLLWALGFLAASYVPIRALARRRFSQYLALNLYMLALAFENAGLFVIFRRYGFASMEYRYAYYYLDLLMIVLMFFAITQLYHRVFRELGVSRHIRQAAILLLAGTACFSYIVVQSNVDHLTSRFVVELSQDLYFVGLVLTYLLWAAVLKLRETRARLVQLILALGVYFSATSAAVALRHMFPATHGAVLAIQTVCGTFLPVAWAYTFTKVPEDARLALKRLAGAASPQ